MKISVVIPACDAEDHLRQCLEALRKGEERSFETIVVDDGSKDGTRSVARLFDVAVLSTGRRMGPAFARNLGAEAATGDIVLFLDADVCVRPDTLLKVDRSFALDTGMDALIGSYDMEPAAPDFVSQYRNLMHCFVHQTGSERAWTFWTGCGAIRREVFLEHGGFSVAYGRPAIEDIELGYRLVRSHRKIVMDHSLLVKHLKRWSVWKMVKTDIFDRGIPWTELILRDGSMPNDLNLQLSQRVSVALAFVLVAVAGMAALRGLSPMAAHHVSGRTLGLGIFALIVALGLLNRKFYGFLARRHGIAFLVAAIALHLLYHVYSGISFLIGMGRHFWRVAAQRVETTSVAEESEAR